MMATRTRRDGALGRAVQAWRDEQTGVITDSWIAGKLKVSRGSPSRWFSGEARPTPENLKALADLIGINVDRLAALAERDARDRAERRRVVQDEGRPID